MKDFPRLESRSRRERALKGLHGRSPTDLQAFRPRTGRERPSGRGNDGASRQSEVEKTSFVTPRSSGPVR
jgi:hypothetical protein